MAQVVIVGGGISGLSAAYYLEQLSEGARLDLSILVAEARDRVGGVIQTEKCGEFLFEAGPDSFLSQKPAALELCRELGLGEQLIPSNDERRRTYVIVRGRARQLPEGLMFVIPGRVWPMFRSSLLSPTGKARLALSPFLSPPPPARADVSVAEFVGKRFGQEVVERLAEPLLAAVYGADVDSLSARAVLAPLIALEQQYGSVWRAVAHGAGRTRSGGGAARSKGSLFMTLRDGLGEMIRALKSRLQRTQVVTGREVSGISRGADGGLRVAWRDGETQAPAVILATPAHAASRIVSGLDPRLSQKLAEIPYHSSVIVSFVFDDADLPQGIEGFGFVVPRSERRQVIACTRVTTKFSYRAAAGSTVLRCFLGGARNASILAESDDRIVEIALRELAEITGLRARPQLARVSRWERAMPSYTVGHLERVAEIDALVSAQPGLFLAGNALRGVGIPDCIQSAAAAAKAAVAHLRLKSQHAGLDKDRRL